MQIVRCVGEQISIRHGLDNSARGGGSGREGQGTLPFMEETKLMKDIFSVTRLVTAGATIKRMLSRLFDIYLFV